MCLVGEINTTENQTLATVILPQCAYVLPDGSHAPASNAVVWCAKCDDFTAGESLPNLTSLQTSLADASATPMSDEILFIANGDTEAQQKIIDDTAKRIEWLPYRKDQPKCFECGSTDILRLPDDRSEFNHPDSGQSISISIVFGSTSIDTILFLLDVDGNRLGQATHPRYAKPLSLIHI